VRGGRKRPPGVHSSSGSGPVPGSVGAARWLGRIPRGPGGGRSHRPGHGGQREIGQPTAQEFQEQRPRLGGKLGGAGGWGAVGLGRSPPGLGVWGVGAGAAAGPRGNGADGRPAGDACANAPGSLCRAGSASAGERGAGARPARPRPARRSRLGAGAEPGPRGRRPAGPRRRLGIPLGPRRLAPRQEGRGASVWPPSAARNFLGEARGVST
jgi:hypothetical protein